MLLDPVTLDLAPVAARIPGAKLRAARLADRAQHRRRAATVGEAIASARGRSGTRPPRPPTGSHGSRWPACTRSRRRSGSSAAVIATTSIVAEYGDVARAQLVCALQVHVAVGSAERTLAVYNALRGYLPELAALAANSPFLRRSRHRAGVGAAADRRAAPAPGRPAGLRLLGATTRTRWPGSVPEPGSWWWELRPHLNFGTLEVRVCDAQTTLEEAAAVTAFVHAWWRGWPSATTWTRRRSWRIAENRWAALRYGVEATFKDLDEHRARRPVRDVLLERVETLTPVAERLGCADELALVPRADRAQRRDAPARGRAAGAPRAGSPSASSRPSGSPRCERRPDRAISPRSKTRHRPGAGPARRWRRRARRGRRRRARHDRRGRRARAAGRRRARRRRRTRTRRSGTGPRSSRPAASTGADANQSEDCRIVGVVNSVQDYWSEDGRRLPRGADALLHAARRRPGCGGATLGGRPVLLPGRPGRSTSTCAFYDELRSRFGASGGPFAEAYVIAHEYGHHVQHLLGTDREGRRRPRGRDVRLGAAGAAGRLLRRRVGRERRRDRLHRGPHRPDIEDGLDAAAAVGDDRIQQARHRPRRSARAGPTARPPRGRSGSTRATAPATPGAATRSRRRAQERVANAHRGAPRVAREEAASTSLGVGARGARTAATSSAVRQLDRPVTQADGVLRRGADALAAPDVEAEVVVVAAGADERGAAEVRLHLEAEHVAVEREAPVDVADVQVQVAHPQARARTCGVGVLALDRGQQRAEVQRRRAARVAEVRRARRSSRRSAASSMPLPSGSGR